MHMKPSSLRTSSKICYVAIITTLFKARILYVEGALLQSGFSIPNEVIEVIQLA
jgi:hypothetical protein